MICKLLRLHYDNNSTVLVELSHILIKVFNKYRKMRTVAFFLALPYRYCELIMPDNCDSASQNVSFSCLTYPQKHQDAQTKLSSTIIVIFLTILLIPTAIVIWSRLFPSPKQQTKDQTPPQPTCSQEHHQEMPMKPEQNPPPRIRDQYFRHAIRAQYENTQQIVQKLKKSPQYNNLIKMKEEDYQKQHAAIEQQLGQIIEYLISFYENSRKQ